MNKYYVLAALAGIFLLAWGIDAFLYKRKKNRMVVRRNKVSGKNRRRRKSLLGLMLALPFLGGADSCDRAERRMQNPPPNLHVPAPGCYRLNPPQVDCCREELIDAWRHVVICRQWVCTDNEATCLSIGRVWDENRIRVTENYVEQRLDVVDAYGLEEPIFDGGIEDGGVGVWDGGIPEEIPMEALHLRN